MGNNWTAAAVAGFGLAHTDQSVAVGHHAVADAVVAVLKHAEVVDAGVVPVDGVGEAVSCGRGAHGKAKEIDVGGIAAASCGKGVQIDGLKTQAGVVPQAGVRSAARLRPADDLADVIDLRGAVDGAA